VVTGSSVTQKSLLPRFHPSLMILRVKLMYQQFTTSSKQFINSLQQSKQFINNYNFNKSLNRLVNSKDDRIDRRDRLRIKQFVLLSKLWLSCSLSSSPSQTLSSLPFASHPVYIQMEISKTRSTQKRSDESNKFMIRVGRLTTLTLMMDCSD
jgi:hypothetical protein